MGAAVSMRLEGQHQAAIGPAGTYCLQGCRDLAGMMPIVVDQHDVAVADPASLPGLKAPSDTLKRRQRRTHRLDLDTQLTCDRDRRQCVEHIVTARHVESHIEGLLRLDVHTEARSHPVLLDIRSAHIGIAARAVCDDLACHLGQQLAHVVIIDAHDRLAVERQVMQEFEEGRTQAHEVVAVGDHVVFVDIGHHGDHRLQIEERRVALIGFGDQDLTFTQMRIAAARVETATDHIGRIQAALDQDAGGQAGCRGLAMRTSHRDAISESHDFGQHLGTRHDRDALLACRPDLGIVVLDRTGYDDRIRATDMRCLMSDMNARTLLCQPLGGSILFDIRARDLVAEIEHDLGDAIHPGTANSDEVQAAHAAHRLGGIATWPGRDPGHAANSSQTSATRPVASRCAMR